MILIEKTMQITWMLVETNYFCINFHNKNRLLQNS